MKKRDVKIHELHDALDYMPHYSTRISKWLVEPLTWPDDLGRVVELECRTMMFRLAQKNYNKLVNRALRDEVHVYTEVKNFESEYGAESVITHWFIFKMDHGGKTTKIGIQR